MNRHDVQTFPSEVAYDHELVLHKMVTPFEPPERSVSDTRAQAVEADPERRQLLHEVQQDRAELVGATEQLMGPVQTLQNAKDALVMTGRSLPWIALAGNVIAIAMYLRKRQRPPITLLLGLSIQIFKAISASRSTSTTQQARLTAP